MNKLVIKILLIGQRSARFSLLLTIVGLLLPFTLRAQDPQRVLVAYFSLRGGATRLVAEEIHRQVGGDLFRIEAETPYPSEYQDVLAQAREERDRDIYPKLKELVPEFAAYDTIYLGMPIWLGRVPAVVRSFLVQHNFEGKVVVSFATSGKSSIAKLMPYLRELLPHAKLVEGILIPKAEVDKSAIYIAEWLRTLHPIEL